MPASIQTFMSLCDKFCQRQRSGDIPFASPNLCLKAPNSVPKKHNCQFHQIIRRLLQYAICYRDMPVERIRTGVLQKSEIIYNVQCIKHHRQAGRLQIIH